MTSESTNISSSNVATVRRNAPPHVARRIRRIAATTTALTFMLQNLAWAVCSDGTTFPTSGFTPATAVNWTPFTFTGTLGSVWVPDISVNEHNNPGEPLTGGGHDWVFDQGTATCKETDVGGASGPPTAWAIPVINFTDCMILPIFRGSVIQNFGDFPQHGTALTPTCDPTKLSTNGPNPANTYFNQLGCALVQQATGQVQATTPETAATYLFTAGIKSGLFSIALTSVNTLAPGEAGKVNGMSFTYYAQIPAGLRLDSAVITPDGQFLLGGSSRTNDEIYACRNPLGDPGDPAQPLPSLAKFGPTTDANSTSANTPGVQCMQIGQGGDSRVKGLAVGADGQPYIGGLNIVSNFTNFPACITANTPFTIAQAFAAHSSNHCGTAKPNAVLNTSPDGTTAIKNETFALVSHGQYLYRTLKGGIVYQAKVDATAGVTAQRFFATGLATPTGIGFSEGMASTMIYDDLSALSLANQIAVRKLPICEDMP